MVLFIKVCWDQFYISTDYFTMPVKIKKPFYIISSVFIKVCDIIFFKRNKAEKFAICFLELGFKCLIYS
ncbi:hypothetical protein EM308_17625 [Flavobacterium gilvum]|uniref:Uncharacterized protein n=1 Tax=Flavobacterium gilvum TaxID=1492737 RepID=A0AAC9N4S0_9FLAO|nr:hypothetical protein EM308_17625 [Flavobacterium gilvum]